MEIKLPQVCLIEFHLDKAAINLLEKGIVSEVKMPGIMEISPGRKIKVDLLINKVISPADKLERHSQKCLEYNDFDKTMINGIEKAYAFLINHLSQNSWILSGRLKGDSRTEFIALYFEDITMTVLAIKPPSENETGFFPKEMMN